MKKENIGARGEAWVLAQLALLVLFLFVPQVGPDWPAPLVFRLVGGVLALAGIAVLGWSALSQIGRAHV